MEQHPFLSMKQRLWFDLQYCFLAIMWSNRVRPLGFSITSVLNHKFGATSFKPDEKLEKDDESMDVVVVGGRE